VLFYFILFTNRQAPEQGACGWEQSSLFFFFWLTSIKEVQGARARFRTLSGPCLKPKEEVFFNFLKIFIISKCQRA
jgi:hypothetical protein